MVHGCTECAERAETAAVSRGTSHASAVSTPLRWTLKNALQKASHSRRITHAASLRSLVVSADVKHHVYFTFQNHMQAQCVRSTAENSAIEQRSTVNNSNNNNRNNNNNNNNNNNANLFLFCSCYCTSASSFCGWCGCQNALGTLILFVRLLRQLATKLTVLCSLVCCSKMTRTTIK